MVTLSDFIDRFHALLRTRPRYNLKQVQVENCHYADTALKSKNCYYSFGTFYSEDVLYSRYSRKCSDCADIALCVGCEHCLDCSDCAYCFDSSQCTNCQNCMNCESCFECYSCSNCIGCVGLHRKQFCIFNEQLSEAEFRRRQEALRRNDATVCSTAEQLRAQVPLPALHLFRCEDCLGSHLSECARCWYCFDSFALEDCAYCVETNGNRSCLDLTVCFENELCTSCIHSPLNYGCNFLLHVDQSSFSDFCAYSKGLKNCFGCVALANSQFHILNEEYSEADYRTLTGRLRQELAASGQLSMELFFATAYETSRLESEVDLPIQLTMDLFGGDPMAAGAIKKKCTKHSCQKEFLVVTQEQTLYAQKQLPLPEHCPTCRHRARMALRSERQLYRRSCGKCGESILTTYPNDVAYTIYCQECFWTEIT